MKRLSIVHPVLLAAVMALLAFPQTGFAQSASELSTELNGLEGQVGALQSRYIKPIDVDTSATSYGIEARYNDGRVAYHLQRYNHAASLLHSVVQDPQFESFGSRREGTFMLGDSLYRVRNYIGARRQFRKLLDSGTGEYYEESAARLLEMAYELRDFSTLDSLFNQLSGSSMSGRIAYLSGKAFYEQGNFERARESFARAAQSPEYQMIGQYFSGVSFVAEKKYSEAKRVFNALVNATVVQNEKDQEVVDLSWLALGRIAYEEGDIERAIDNYSRLERSSPHFDRSLWEQTWVLVSRGNYEEARRNVDIITYLDDPDADILAKSQLLRADLSLELGEYETARADYRAVLDRFGPIQQQMDEFAANHEDLQTFFSAVVDPTDSGRGGMPPLIEQWMSTDKDMREATTVLRAMQRAEDYIEQTYLMFDQLGGASARVQADPTLAEGFKKAVEIENRLVQIEHQLVSAQLAAVEKKMTDEQKTAWAAIAAELDALRVRHEALTAKGEDGKTESEDMTDELNRVQQQLNETGRDIESVRAQLTAIENLLSGSSKQLSDAERTEAEKAKVELNKNIAEMTAEEERLRGELDSLRETNPLREAETQTHRSYVEKLAEAAAFLNQLGGPPEVQTARATIATLREKLIDFFRGLDDMALASVQGFSVDVTAQRALVDEHQKSLQQLVTTSQSGAGVLAYVNFMKARAEYTEIVLRGEVGIIDVVWKKKEDMSEKISKLFEDRTSELNLLQEAFEEVR